MAKMRVCTKCGNSLEESNKNFYVRKRGGFMSHCKSCISISYAAKYAESTEEIRAHQNSYYKQNAERIQQSRKERRESVTEHKLKHVLRNAKQRASVKNFDFDLDYEYLLSTLESQDWKCFYSGTPLALSGEFKLSLDRTDSTKGYVKGNINFSLHSVNQMKSNIPHETFLKLCRLISENST